MDADSNDLIASRRRKLDTLRASGTDPFPNDFSPEHTTEDVEMRFGSLGAEELSANPSTVAVAGRMVSRRDFGRASFFHLQDRAGRIQVYVKRDEVGEDDFGTFKQTDHGDFIGVVGKPFRTKTDELTIQAQKVRLLSKSLRPLPEKWHGLTDVEARYRQRYLDLIGNDAVRTTFRRRAQIIQFIRGFLVERDFVEVETPMMQAVAGGAAARPFVTHHNALDVDLYLRIAPELYLKRLLVGGLDRVFELNRVFRNEGVSTLHNPEFTLLEFYQAYATYEDLMRMTEDLFVGLADAVLGTRVLRYGDAEVDLSPPWRRVSIPEYVATRAEVPLEGVLELDPHVLETAAGRLRTPLAEGLPRPLRRGGTRLPSDRSVRSRRRAGARAAHLRLRLSGRRLAAGAPQRALAELRRSIRAFHRRWGNGERLLGAERSRRPALPSRGPTSAAGGG